MPYANEHAARLRSPGDFSKTAWRRTKGGTIYGRIKVPATVGIIWGKLKGKDKPSDMPIPQSLRFNKKSWTADKAKSWLKTHNIKNIGFERAKVTASEESLSEDNATGVRLDKLVLSINGGQLAITPIAEEG